MQGDFHGEVMMESKTPDGGLVETGFGTIVGENGKSYKGFYMKVSDHTGATVCECGLTGDTFKVLLKSFGHTLMAAMKKRMQP